MKKYPHQQFIEDNAIDINSLPKMLQKRIGGFEELENDLQYTTGQDHTELLDKLETLSHEIQEDLDEEFEEQLLNNDVEEEPISIEEKLLPKDIIVIKEEPEPEPEPAPKGEPEYKPEPEEEEEEPKTESEFQFEQELIPKSEFKSEPHPNPDPTPTLDETTNIQSNNQNVVKTIKDEPLHDEEILEKMFFEQKFKVSSSELIRKGFQRSLDKKIKVGKYILHRGKYDNYYQLTLIEDRNSK